MRFLTGLERDSVRPSPIPRMSWARLVLLVAVGATSVSCALLADEDSLPPSPTITVPTTAAVTTTNPPTTTALLVPQTTTTTVSATTSTAPSVGPALGYLEQLLAAEARYTALAESIRAINDDWDNLPRTDGSFAAAETALEEAAGQAAALRDAFALIEPPPEPGLGEQHRIAQGSADIMADTVPEMLEGLRSTDTGETRRVAVLGFLTAYDLLQEVTSRVAAIVGDEGQALLAAERTSSSPTVSDDPAPETTTTTVAADAPPNPGNTKNCSDFATHAEAQAWFDTYYPFYGDIAQMDTNANLVACENLLNQETG